MGLFLYDAVLARLPASGEDMLDQPRPQVVEEMKTKQDRKHADHQAVDHEGDPQRKPKNVSQKLQ